jgi:cytidylate kinase
MYFITFSRQVGAKGTDIAKLVAKELQYNFYDTADIERKAIELGYLNDIREVDEKTPSLFKQIFSRQPEIWLEHLYTAIYDLSRQGNAVILGRGGNILFRTIPQALHVRVIASQETRINNFLERGYQREDAVICMEKSDYERSSFLWFAFHKDWSDPGLYDFVLNMDNLTVNVAADTILCAARLRESEYGSKGISSLDLLGLAARVSSALTKSGFPSGYVSPFVTAPGKVRLTGLVQAPREKLAAELTVLKVEGVESVENEIKVASR